MAALAAAFTPLLWLIAAGGAICVAGTRDMNADTRSKPMSSGIADRYPLGAVT